MSDSDEDVSSFISPSSIRPSMRRDVGMGSGRQTSTIVKAAARRQLRGDSDKRPVKEVAAEIRKKLQNQSSEGPSERDQSGNRSPSAARTPYQNENRSSCVEPRVRQAIIRRKRIGASFGTGNVGIGIKFTELNSEHIVTSLLPEGPAELSGLVFKGDKIVAVDGVPIFGKSSNEVIDLILGPPGMDVVLSVQSADYNGQDILSPGFQQTPGSQPNHTTNGSPLMSVDSPSSGEFKLVSPDQIQQKGSGYLAVGTARDFSIGINFVIDKRQCIKVEEIIPSMPADECKRIHVGDMLLRVDGVDVVGKEASAIEKLIAGPYGSPVSLTLQSDHDNERRSVRLARKETLGGSFVKASSVPVENIVEKVVSRGPTPQRSVPPPSQMDIASLESAIGKVDGNKALPLPQEPTVVTITASSRRVEEQIANPMLPPEEHASPQMKHVDPTVPLEKFQEVAQELKEVTQELERKIGALEAKIEEQKKAGLSSESKLESKLSSKTDTKVLSDVQAQLEQKLKVQEQKLKSQEDSIASLNAKLEQYNKKQGCACVIS